MQKKIAKADVMGLERLTYIDLYLLHAPYGGKEGRLGAWQALVESVAEGKVRSIGVSNYGGRLHVQRHSKVQG